VPDQVPVASLGDDDLRALNAEFVEVLVSPVRLGDLRARE